MVIPYVDLKYAAAYRLTADTISRECIWEVAQLGWEIHELQASLSASKDATTTKALEASQCDERVTVLEEQSAGWQRKARRRGRVVVVMGIVVATLLAVR